ncbi:hypothetical protein AALP_AA4G247500 [Arabis alpina]|uniref:C2 domain-containing protein n=1 Tax=Arabis alpina TaxID=50452 RepID=A0A087H5G5_ARAAL|nr:hypothetical protein AALP_AA4G247500 [Arabis alpina]
MSSYSTSMQRSLEIELISAEGLQVNRKPVKKNTFCVVKIDDKTRSSKPDELGGNYPIWKDKIEMEIPINGSVRLRDEYGDKSGIVNVSIMVKPNGGDIGQCSLSSSSTVVAAPVDYAKCSSQATATVNGQMWKQNKTSSSSTMPGYGGRVVTGVPVSWAYQRS